ncbi:hypothetical protein Tco_0459075 [Tanacetum coccineum]
MEEPCKINDEFMSITRNGDDVLDILGLDSSILGMKVQSNEGKALVKVRIWARVEGFDYASNFESRKGRFKNEAMFCYFDAFLTSVEPNNYKEDLKESCWIEAMQEELNKFK